MFNSVTNSHIDNASLAHLGIGNIVTDANTVAIVFLGVALIIVAIAILAIVHYKRDKDNIPSLHKIENKIDFYSLDLIRINNRLRDLEDKERNLEELHKSINELKSLIQRRKNV